MWCVFLKIEPPGIAFDYIRGGAAVPPRSRIVASPRRRRATAVPPPRHAAAPPLRRAAAPPRRRAAATPRRRDAAPRGCCPGYVDGNLTIKSVSARLPSSVPGNHPRGDTSQRTPWCERAIPEGPQSAYLQGGWGYAPQRNDPMGQKKNQTSFVFWASAEISMFVCCVEIMKLRFGSVDHLLAVDR